MSNGGQAHGLDGQGMDERLDFWILILKRARWRADSHVPRVFSTGAGCHPELEIACGRGCEVQREGLPQESPVGLGTAANRRIEFHGQRILELEDKNFLSKQFPQ